MINVFSNNHLSIPLPKMAVHSKHYIIYCRGLQTGTLPSPNTLPAISPDYGPMEGVVWGREATHSLAWALLPRETEALPRTGWKRSEGERG